MLLHFPLRKLQFKDFPHLPGLMPPWIQCIGTVPLRMRFIRLKDPGIHWQGMASFLPLFLVLECLFWLAYVFVLSQQELYKSTFSLKCQMLFGLDLNFGSANHPSFWNMPRHQWLGPYPHFCLLQRHWKFLLQSHVPRCHSSDGFCFALAVWALFGIM